jgi:hypothetical protein
MAAKETIVLSVETDSSKAEGSVKSLKAQLREAQAEVGKMADKFGETSVQAVQAAKKAADLKDRIGDAKALTDAFNPDKKFQAFSSAIQGVVGGFTALQGAQALFGTQSKELEETLVKVQGAMALSQGLSAITEAQDSFKNLKAVAVNVFQSIKAAIGASGIGLLVIALGTIYAYWDDIKEAVSGVSAQQKKLLENQKKSQETAQKSLDAVSKQENILKLQGKSERDILNLKIAGTKQVIASLEAQITTQEEIKKQQIATAQRNQDILKGILDFLTLPLRGILKTIDAAGKAIGKDFGLAEGLTKGISELVFNPKKVAEEGDKTINETKAKLTELKNQQAGFQLEIKKQDEDAAKKKKDTADKSAEEIREANKKANEDILKLQQENTLARIKDDRKRAEAKLEMDLESSKKEIESSKASADIKAKQIQALEEKYMLDLNALKEKNRIEDEKKAKDALDKQLKAEEETFKIVNEARINQIKDQNIKRQELEATRYQSDIDNLYTQLNNKEITESDFNARMQAAKLTHESNLTAIEKQASDERIKQSQAEYQAKVQLVNEISNVLGELGNVVGQQTGFGKAMALAQIAIDTGVAISSLTRNSEANPANALTGGISGAIQFATGLARILANIAKAKQLLSQAKVPGGGGGGGGTPNIPTAAPIAPQMSQTALNQQLINQTGNAAARAFVLESDVSGNQERIRRLNRAARIN